MNEEEGVLRSLGTHFFGMIRHLRGACISIDRVATRPYNVSENCRINHVVHIYA